ncbi:CHASE2 domain-containing protein [Noviherbaspirillum sedimenti]|uniref:Adenylate/guanylate cyclase domain-containing protein n=1 Tax=Noviherbaspirillum sedimenti TaxID=2320865 RepID=A0A3A3G0Q3_9BURK|nr:adenylate/guanylate cyclase domain-containing protein [Noviherbaspirillum sedimenti]RJG01215.1 adenylate/guanylate cyclase domain-containing protein [Noviherbaspirillum sedimenti]
MRRFLSRFGLRWTIGLALTLAALAQVLGYLPATVAGRIDQIDQAVYDTRLKLTPPVFDPRIAIVSIDERSLAEVGRWPWSREVMARMVDQLFDKYRIKALGFDVTFSEPDNTSGYATLAALAQDELRGVPQLGERLRQLKPALDYDARLARALRDRPVVLGYFLSDTLKKGMLPAPGFTLTDLGGYAVDALSARAYEGNLAELQQAARAGGYFNTDFDADGLLRATPLMMRVGDAYYESLALATARVALGAARVQPVLLQADVVNSAEELRQYGVLAALKLDSQPFATVIPVEHNLTARIQYRGPGGPQGGAFHYVSAADVLKGRVAPEALADRIVLVGTTAPGLNDLRATPVKADYPGVEVHANLVASILDNDFKKRPDFGIGIDLVQVLLLGLVLTVALSTLSPLWSILIALAAVAAAISFNSWMYQAYHYVLPVATALLLILGLFIFNVAWGYLFEYRKGRAIVNLFGEYVAPELVAEMAKDPQSYSMAGDLRELTIMFSDVRGFTTISEGLEPNALREYVNIYLTAMSEDIRGNRGTLDKYIGDAVMAFWGAPIALPNHAALAVKTALQMQASAGKLNQEFIARGWPPLRIGIGLNTGEVRVGDMGSAVRRAYTVMGDPVNLASRLEGITKTYGAGIVVGQGTRSATPEFLHRELDLVQVKGKNEPVPIFEPLGMVDAADEAIRAAVTAWHAALALFRSQQWDAAQSAIEKLAAAQPLDLLYPLYLQRIANYRANPPGDGWDAVTVFDAK